MRVCLRKKFAEAIDGIDLSGRAVGDVLDLKASEATLLIAEDWAIPERRAQDRKYAAGGSIGTRERSSRAADRPRRSPRARPRQA